MQRSRRTRIVRQILNVLKLKILGLVVFVAGLLAFRYYAALGWDENKENTNPAKVEVEFNGAPKGSRQANATITIQCDWCDSNQVSDENTYCDTTSEFKPPSQTRLPSISSVSQDNAGVFAVRKINVLLVSVDVCSLNKQQHARVIPAIPSHYRTFAMMKLHLGSLPYTNILSAQRAGYAGVLFFSPSAFRTWGSVPQCATALHQKSEEMSEQIFIPVLIGSNCDRIDQFGNREDMKEDELNNWISNNLNFTPAKVSVTPEPNEKLKRFKSYLRQLYWWLLVGPLLTLIWFILKTKQLPGLCQPEEPAEPESPMACHQLQVDQSVVDGNRRDRENENAPLLLNHHEPTEERNNAAAANGCSPSVKRLTRYTTHLLWLLGCFIFPLPLGISAGGLVFLRLDENDATDFVNLSFIGRINFSHCEQKSAYDPCFFISQVVNGMFLLWSPVQVFFFLMYSKVKCRRAWIIQNNSSKIIRCSWFKSGILLLVLGFIVPLGVSIYEAGSFILLSNTLCTISNCIFLLVLNKHSRCTLFVFYTSVCMVCAHIESSVVVIMYFMLNSVGSLGDLKTTAIRTAEIYAALGLSFQTSMHIIHKLQKPGDSLFSNLGES